MGTNDVDLRVHDNRAKYFDPNTLYTNWSNTRDRFSLGFYNPDYSLFVRKKLLLFTMLKCLE